MFRILFAIVLILSMSACAGIPDGAPPVGRLTLNGPVTIPPGAATLRLQYGRPTAFNAVQEQDPFCVFELDTVGEKAQVVEPASFDILAVQFRIEAIAGAQASPFPVMRVSMSLYDDDDGGPSHIYYKTAFRLGPNPQRARNLTCMSNQWMPGIPIMRHLTLREMRDALGSHFTLDLDGPRQNR